MELTGFRNGSLSTGEHADPTPPSRSHSLSQLDAHSKDEPSLQRAWKSDTIINYSSSEPKIARTPIWSPHVSKMTALTDRRLNKLYQVLCSFCKDWLDFKANTFLAPADRKIPAIELIGKGTFSHVYVHKKVSGIALKLSKGESDTRTKEQAIGCINDLINEGLHYIEIGDHPNIAKYFGSADICLEPGETQRIMGIQRYRMNFRQYLKSDHPEDISGMPREYIIRKSILGISRAITHLQKKNILHRDLKTENILLLFNDYGIKALLSDFGAACLNTKEQRHIYDGISKQAPELLKYYTDGKFRNHTIWTEAWAFGTILMEIACFPSDPPYFAKTIESKKQVAIYRPDAFLTILKKYKFGTDNITLEEAVSKAFISLRSFETFMTMRINPTQLKINQFSLEMQLFMNGAACMRMRRKLRMLPEAVGCSQEEWLKKNITFL